MGVIVHVDHNGQAFAVEFMTLVGNTLSVETLKATQIRAARNRDIPHIRCVWSWHKVTLAAV